MKFLINKKLHYVLCCILLVPFLFGCKGVGKKITVLYGLDDSVYVNEFKSSLESKKPVVVSFTAEWCPHCRSYKPVFFEVKDQYKDKASFINIDVDSKEGSSIVDRFQVNGIPSTAFIRIDGSIFKVQVGGIKKEDLAKITDELIESKKKKRDEPIAPFPIDLQARKPSEEKPGAIPPEKEIAPPQDLIKQEETPKQEEVKEEIPPQVPQEIQMEIKPPAQEESLDLDEESVEEAQEEDSSEELEGDEELEDDEESEELKE